MPTLSASKVNDITVLPTNTFLDSLTGLGGLPRGRIVQFYGETNTGKSTAGLHVVAAAQKEGLNCLWVDVEHQYTNEYAQKIGVDTSKLMVMREATAEEYMDETEAAVKSGKYQVIVFDSIGDLSSRVEQEKSAGERTIGVQASLMTRFSRLIAPYVVLNKILFIGINHERKDFMNAINGKAKLMVLGGLKWSEKVKLSIRFRVKSGALLKRGEEVVGRVLRVSVTKNHIGSTEGLELEARLINGEGFVGSLDLLDAAIRADLFKKEGNSYFWKEEKIGTIGKLRDWIKEHEEEVKAALA